MLTNRMLPTARPVWTPGLRFKWHAQPYQVLDRAAGQVTILSDRLDCSEIYAIDELDKALAKREIKLISPPQPAVLAKPLSPEQKRHEEAFRRLRYVEAYRQETDNKGDRNVLERVIERVSQEIGDPKPPCVTTLYTWLRSYVSASQNIGALHPRTDRSGNRDPRLPDEVRDLLDQALDEHYLQENRPTLQETDAWLKRLIRSINQTRPADEQIKPPSYNALTHWLRTTVDPYDIVLRRHGARAAMREFRGRGQGPISPHPLARAEIDHTILDILLVDDEGVVIGRPTFTWVLDCHSRCILGFHLGWDKPSSIAVLETMDQALQDKTPTLAAIPEAAGLTWEMSGVATEIICDNGAEFAGKHFQNYCAAHSMNVQYCPPAMPWYKGACERFVRTLNTGLIHTLPGTTFSNPKMRGDYKAEDLACITLREMDQLIRRWIVCLYHQRRHRTLGATPYQAWKDGIAKHPVRQVDNDAVAAVALGMSYTATLCDGVVQFETRQYFAPELVRLGKQLGRDRRVDIRCSHRDISVAHIKHPKTKEWIPATCRTLGVVPGMSLVEFKQLKKLAKIAPAAPGMEVITGQRLLSDDVRRHNDDAAEHAEAVREEKRRKKRQSAAKKAGMTKKEEHQLKTARQSRPPAPVPVPAKPRDAFDDMPYQIIPKRKSK